MKEIITVKEFVTLVCDNLLCPTCHDNLLCPICHGRNAGWLEDEDQRFQDNPLNRRTAARIVHQFMKIELGIADCTDIKEAEVLKDLYTCRVCANHVAQVFVRKIMGCQEIEQGGQTFKIFNHLDLVSEKESLEIINKIKNLQASIK